MVTTQEALNRSTNVNVADNNIGQIMARGIYRANNMSAGDALTSGVICIVPGNNNRSGIRLGVSGKAETIGGAFIGVDGVAKTIKKGLIGVPSVTHNLPAGYTEQSYIAASGTQWINTGVAPTTPRIELTVSDLACNSSIAYLAGTYDGSSTTQNFAIGVSTSGVLYYRYRTNATQTTNASISGKHDIVMSTTNITVDGTNIVTLSGTYSKGSNNFALFGAMDGTTPYSLNRLSSMRLYGAKIYDGSTLLRHYIPAARDSDGVAGLYDLVSQSFYGNSGTGSFAAGGTVSAYAAKVFYQEPLVFVPVVITGTGMKNYVYLTINGTNYTRAATLNLNDGNQIVCNVYGYNNQYPGVVTVNDVEVLRVTSYRSGTYTFTIPEGTQAVAINMTYGSTAVGKTTYWYGTISIDTE